LASWEAGGAEAEHHFKYILRHQEIIQRFGRFPTATPLSAAQ
jgi:uncharacterized protein (DUF924 family)